MVYFTLEDWVTTLFTVVVVSFSNSFALSYAC